VRFRLVAGLFPLYNGLRCWDLSYRTLKQHLANHRQLPYLGEVQCGDVTWADHTSTNGRARLWEPRPLVALWAELCGASFLSVVVRLCLAKCPIWELSILIWFWSEEKIKQDLSLWQTGRDIFHEPWALISLHQICSRNYLRFNCVVRANLTQCSVNFKCFVMCNPRSSHFSTSGIEEFPKEYESFSWYAPM